MTTTSQTERYDAVVIGSGQGGTPLARALAEAGWKTALVEREHVGGTCINEGCTPTKTMVASARAAYLASRSAAYGVATAPVRVDLPAVRARKRAVVDSFRGGSQRRLESTKNLRLIFGEACFEGPHDVAIRANGGKERRVQADRVLINAGARPARPRLEGGERVSVLDSTSIMELDEIPAHLLVLGGGYVGLEFGQMFRRFGSQVTIVQRPKQLLGREDQDVADAVAEILREDGIEILLESEAKRVDPTPDGRLELTVATPMGERQIIGTHLLAAAGRVPNTDTLNLPAAGVAVDKSGFIPVNDRLETNVPGIFAFGDIKGGPAFTHISYDDFRILRTNLIGAGDASTADRLVPYAVFIDPQLGRVGLSESEARASGRDIRVATLPMSHVARAIEVGETRGMMKAVVDAQSQQILGCAILGIEGGELMAMLEIAMMGKVPYTALRDGIFAHPTLAEAFNNLFASLNG